LLDVGVDFGGVSVGADTASIGVGIPRESIALEDADDILCGHRLVGDLVKGCRDDQTAQAKLLNDMELLIHGAFDVKRIGVSPERITARLSFSRKDVAVNDIADLSNTAGRLRIAEVGELPGDDDNDEGQAEEG